MKKIKVETVIKAGIDEVWECWNEPEHITEWAFASDDWESPYADNELREGGRYVTRMSAKDGSATFDVTGVYKLVTPKTKIESVMDDGRTVSVEFEELADGAVKVMEEFEMESENSEELQRSGWQAILDNFKKHVEGH